MKKLTYLLSIFIFLLTCLTTNLVYAETPSPIKVTSITSNSTKVNTSTIFSVTGENLPELFGAKTASGGGTNYNNFDFNDSKTSWGRNPSDAYGINVISSSSSKLEFTLAGNFANYTSTNLFKIALSPTNSAPLPVENAYYYQGSYNIATSVFFPAPLIPNNFKGESKDLSVTLHWDKNDQSDFAKYNIYQDGKLITSIEQQSITNYNVLHLLNGTEYKFQISTVDSLGHESFKSDEIAITPNSIEPTKPSTPTGERAILVVTMTTGLEKEFDLSMTEVEEFIAWYESKQAGSGKAAYAIDKHDNNKGPFTSRKEYMIFDKILTFEVGEYSNK